MINKIVLIGRITKDLELKESSSGNKYCTYSIAVNRDSEHTDFINCATFGSFSEKLVEYVKKGDLIAIEGKLQSSKYEKDGSNYTSYTVVSDKIQFLSGKHEEPKEDASIKSDTFEITDDDLPF